VEFYESEATIQAPPDRVWSILQDGAGYASWDSGISDVKGQIADGKKIKFTAKVNPKRPFAVRVSTDDANHTMTWSGGMPFGLFRGVRTFRLDTPTPGTTHFTMREEYTGPLLKMIWKKMPDLGPSFVQLAKGLKAKAESKA
jgi:hypothetical protein